MLFVCKPVTSKYPTQYFTFLTRVQIYRLGTDGWGLDGLFVPSQDLDWRLGRLWPRLKSAHAAECDEPLDTLLNAAACLGLVY